MPQKDLQKRGFSKVRQKPVQRRQVIVKRRDTRTAVRLDPRKKSLLQTEKKTPLQQLTSELKGKGYKVVTRGNKKVLVSPQKDFISYEGTKSFAGKKVSSYRPEEYIFDNKGNLLQKIERDTYTKEILKDDDGKFRGKKRIYKVYDKAITTYENNKPVKKIVNDVALSYSSGSKSGDFRRTERKVYKKEVLDFTSGRKKTFQAPKETRRGFRPGKEAEKKRILTEQKNKFERFFQGKPVKLNEQEKKALKSAIGTAYFKDLTAKVQLNNLVKKQASSALEKDLIEKARIQKARQENYNKTGGWPAGSKQAAEFSKLSEKERNSIIKSAAQERIFNTDIIRKEFIQEKIKKDKNLKFSQKALNKIKSLPSGALKTFDEALNDLSIIIPKAPGVIKSMAKGAFQYFNDATIKTGSDVKDIIKTFNVVPEYYKLYKTTKGGKINKKDLPKIKKSINKIKSNLKTLKSQPKNIFKRKDQKILSDISKGIISAFISLPVSYVKGGKDTLLYGSDFTSLPEVYQYSKEVKKLSKNKLSKKEKINKAIKLSKKWDSFFKKGQFKILDLNPTVYKSTKDGELFQFITLLSAGGLVALAGGGIPAALAGAAFYAFDAYQTARSALDFLKRPTAEKFGELSFFALPYTLGILKRAKKLSPNVRANVKNVDTFESIIKNIETDLIKSKKTINKNLKKANPKTKRLLNKKKKKINKLLDDIKKSRKELKYAKNNKNLLKTRDYNPNQYTNELLKLIDSYQTGYHVSTGTPSKLFGQLDLLTEKQITKLLKKDLAKIKQPKKIAKVKETKINKQIISKFKKNNVVLGGGKAQNLQVSLLKKRRTTDFDGKVSSGARRILNDLKKSINREVGINLYQVKKGGNPGTYKLINKNTKAPLVEITNVGRKKIRQLGKVKNPQGLLIESKLSLAKGKISAISTRERFFRKGATDLLDLKRLTGKRLKNADVLKQNPSDVFQVLRQPGGMGKDRLKFDETHLYFDSEAAIGYAQGKKYTIIKFPLSKIQKFPKSFKPKIKKAKLGLLNKKESNALRRQLNKYIKSNLKKFYTSPRTTSLPFGEREWVLAEGSKFFKVDTYKTFDNDLKTFVNVIEVSFNKRKSKSFFKKFRDAYSKEPIKEIKYRLTNPDLLKVRKYRRLIEKGYKLTKPQKSKLSKLADKFIGSFKKLMKDKKGTLRGTLVDDVFKETQKRKATPRVLNIRRMVKRPLKIKAARVTRAKAKTKRRIKKRPKRRKVTRAKSRVTKRPVSRKRTKARVTARPRPKKRVRKTGRTRKRPRIRAILRPRARTLLRNRIRPIAIPRVRQRIKKKVSRQRLIPRKRKKEKEKEERKVKVNQVIKPQFRYLSDLYSRFFGIKVSKRKGRKLLKPGKIFKGFEARPIIK